MVKQLKQVTKSLNQIPELLPEAYDAMTVKSDLGKLILTMQSMHQKMYRELLTYNKFVNNWTALNKQVKGNMADLYGDNLQTINNL